MDSHRSLCIPMDSYRFLWIPMDPYGSPWIPMDPYRSLRIPTDPYGLLWIAMESYGFLWIPMESYGILWDPMESYGPPTTTFNNCLRYIQILPSTTTINYNLQQIPSKTICDLQSNYYLHNRHPQLFLERHHTPTR